ncbi:MAG: RDD family protein [Hydrogenophilus sp.]|nr:RDD family protein [Hydrogenophilus sp.]
MDPFPSLPSPSRSRRLAALLYELMLLIGLVGGGVVLPWTLLALLLHWVPPPPLLWAHLLSLLALYFTWQWRRRGATLAMKTWRLRLVAADGTPPTWKACWLRFLWAWPSLLTGIGFLWSLWDPERLWLHDRLSRTRLILWNWDTPSSS